VRNPFRVALPLLSLLSVNAQDPTAPLPTQPRDPKIFEKYERQVAQTFESIRRDSALPKLSRITHRQQLDQLVCTAALNDANSSGENAPANLMYKTSDPTSVTEEMKSIARYHDELEPRLDTRYAVSIWPGTDKETGRRIYWVGIEICQSAFWEFIDNNFTDDRPYRNEWKKMVAPPCRRVR
jgi:hypothetical protein